MKNKFKRNIIKLMKLKNKNENLKFQKIGKEFKEKLRGIWQTGTKLFQNKLWDSVQEQWNFKEKFYKIRGNIRKNFEKLLIL